MKPAISLQRRSKMLATLAGLWLFLSGDVATSTLEQKSASHPTSSGLGLPFSNLPPINAPTATIENLQLPIDPSTQIDLEQHFEYLRAPTGPCKGGQLISSIVSQTLLSWLILEDDAITRQFTHRNQPFVNILHEVEPVVAPGALLTHVELGVVYCWMMRDVIQQQHWPGRIFAGIYTHGQEHRLGRPIGSATVENRPLAVDMVSLSNDSSTFDGQSISQTNLSIIMTKSDNSRLTNVPAVALRERAFLDVFTQMLFNVVKYAPSARLGDSIPFSPNHEVYTWHFRSQFDVALVGNCSIWPRASNLRWIAISEALLHLIEKAAENETWYYEESTTITLPSGLPLVDICFGRE